MGMTRVSAATCRHLPSLQFRAQYRRRRLFRQLLVGDRRLQWSMIVSKLDIKSATPALVTEKLAKARSQLAAGPPQAMVGANRRQIPLIMLARWMTRVSAATCRHLPSLQFRAQYRRRRLFRQLLDNACALDDKGQCCYVQAPAVSTIV